MAKLLLYLRNVQGLLCSCSQLSEKPSDPDVYRLLGKVKYELKDYEGSVAAYRSSASVCESINFEVLRGLTNVLLAANKLDQAVQVLLASRESLKAQDAVTGKSEVNMQDVDPIQEEPFCVYQPSLRRTIQQTVPYWNQKYDFLDVRQKFREEASIKEDLKVVESLPDDSQADSKGGVNVDESVPDNNQPSSKVEVKEVESVPEDSSHKDNKEEAEHKDNEGEHQPKSPIYSFT